MKEIGREKRKKVIKLYLHDGIPRDDIALQADVGQGTVTSIVREIEDALGKETVEAIRSRAVALRKAGVPPETVVPATQLLLRASEKGVSFETSSELFEEVVLELLAAPALAGTTAGELVTATVSTVRLAKDEGIEVSKVPAILQEKKEVPKEIAVQTEAYNKVRDEAKLQSEQALEDAKTTLDELARLKTIRNKLGACGLVTLEKIVEYNEALKKLGHDPKQAVQWLSRIDQLEWELVRLIKSKEKLAQQQADMLSKDRMYAIISRLPITEEVLLSIERMSKTQALALGKDPRIVFGETLIHFATNYLSHYGMSAIMHQDRIKFNQGKQMLNQLDNELRLKNTAIDKANKELHKIQELIAAAKARLEEDHKTKPKSEPTRKKKPVSEIAAADCSLDSYLWPNAPAEA